MNLDRHIHQRVKYRKAVIRPGLRLAEEDLSRETELVGPGDIPSPAQLPEGGDRATPHPHPSPTPRPLSWILRQSWNRDRKSPGPTWMGDSIRLLAEDREFSPSPPKKTPNNSKLKPNKGKI